MAGPSPVAEVCARQPDPVGGVDALLASPSVVAASDPTRGDGAPLDLPDTDDLTAVRASPVGRRTSRARSSRPDIVGTAKKRRSTSLSVIEREENFRKMLRDTMDQSLP